MNTVNLTNRKQFDKDIKEQVINFFDHFEKLNCDFGYQGSYEEEYTQEFIHYMGGKGYADAVNSGSNAIFIALRSLGLSSQAEVAVSAITDPGAISAVIMNGFSLTLMDSKTSSYNTSLEQVKSAITEKTEAVLITHAAGKAIEDIKEIAKFCKEKSLKLIEDCSQAPGAEVHGVKVGNFSDISIFSTMFKKNFSSGGVGGLIFTTSEKYYHLIRAHADRGKDFFNADFDEKDPALNLFPALNFNLDELSCMIGKESLLKLDKVREKRISILRKLKEALQKISTSIDFGEINANDSPFFWPIIVSSKINKKEYTEILSREGVSINPDYKYLVANWPWIKNSLTGNINTPNAIAMINNSFNLLFHEDYTEQDLQHITQSFLKITGDTHE